MTNEELDRARAEEAAKRIKNLGTYGGSLPVYSISAITEAARLAREGWTPPLPVDPDIAEAREIVAQIYDVSWPERADAIRAGGQDNNVENVSALAGIKRGRALAAAEAKPGMVWVKHDGSGECPVDICQPVLVININGFYSEAFARTFQWHRVTHYAVITSPEVAA